MKTALITTTINVPSVLALYRKFMPGVRFFVAADHKTPDAAYQFCHELTGCEIFSVEAQQDMGYKCSSLLGWNTDSRRNIALLEAIKYGAEVIISIDDDMIPLDVHYHWMSWMDVAYPFHGLKLGSSFNWFDAGCFTIPMARQRGLPMDENFIAYPSFVTDAQVGAVQGIILGTPDTGAPEAATNKPFVHSATDILRNGFVVDLQAYTVFNSQFTAFRRELAPTFAQFYNHQGRNTDIIASVLMRRIMRERNLYTYFGPPFGFHARAPRPIFKDLKAEMFGLEWIADFAYYLDECDIRDMSVVDACRSLVERYRAFGDEQQRAYEAWYSDVEKVMG